MNLKTSAKSITETDLFGFWGDSILLVYEDGKWHGLSPLDKNIELRLYPSTKYTWDEKFTYSKLDSSSIGQFWTWNIHDSTFLTLATDFSGDTIFNQGDTVVTKKFLINSLIGDTLIISDCKQTSDAVIRNEAIIMIRKN